MQTKFIEAAHAGGKGNWGKFAVCAFTAEEWARRSAVTSAPLLDARGWTNGHLLVLDLETGEGAIFRHGGLASADLQKHAVWVCPLFAPFLNWLYRQKFKDISELPDLVEFSSEEAEFALSGYRRSGPLAEMQSQRDKLAQECESLRSTVAKLRNYRCLNHGGTIPNAGVSGPCEVCTMPTTARP